MGEDWRGSCLSSRTCRAAGWIAALTLACGPDDDPLASAGGGSTTAVDEPSRLEPTTVATTEASDEPLPPSVGCGCARPSRDLFESYDLEACGWGPCGTIEFQETLADWPEVPYSLKIDVEALDCALDMLIAGTPGLVHYQRWVWTGLHEGFIRIGEGRVGLTRAWHMVDIICPVDPLAVVRLRRRSYFLGCRALASAKARFDCLLDWSEGPPLAVCAGEDQCY